MFYCGDKNVLATDEHGPLRRKLEIMLHVKLVGIIW